MASENSGKAGAIRTRTLDSTDLAAMERHGRREDASGQARRVSNDNPLVFAGLDIVQQREKHVEGRKQQGRTKAVHALVQFPKDLIPNTALAQRAMLRFAVNFINEYYGGNAVFAARLDRDERGTHKVDVFFLPRWDFQYKDGRRQKRCGLGQFTKKAALNRFGTDNRRAQGSALQDAWYEYIRDKMQVPGVMPPERKKTTTKDRVEPEVFALTQEHANLAVLRKKIEERERALLDQRRQVQNDAITIYEQSRILGKIDVQVERVINRNR